VPILYPPCSIISRGFFNLFSEPIESPQAKAEGQRRPDEDDQGGGEKNGEKLQRMMKVIGDLHHDETKGQYPKGNEEEGEIEDC
jgi:hypothetical protein